MVGKSGLRRGRGRFLFYSKIQPSWKRFLKTAENNPISFGKNIGVFRKAFGCETETKREARGETPGNEPEVFRKLVGNAPDTSRKFIGIKSDIVKQKIFDIREPNRYLFISDVNVFFSHITRQTFLYNIHPFLSDLIWFSQSTHSFIFLHWTKPFHGFFCCDARDALCTSVAFFFATN